MAFECLQAFATAQIPDFQCFVIAGADQEAAIAGPGHITDTQFVAGNCFLKFTIVCAPNFDQFISGCKVKNPKNTAPLLQNVNLFVR